MKKDKPHIIFFNLKVHKTIKARTTLFDLIMTLNEVVEKGEEKLISQIILHMVNSGLLKVVR